MNYISSGQSHRVVYVSTYHKIDLPLAEKAFTARAGYSKDGTKPRAVEKEIEIYREALKITKTFRLI
jgi:hypothetical protein